jgi:L-seryl-tRNA(Ser) seleniumtransferase
MARETRDGAGEAFRLLPAVEEVLQTDEVRALAERAPRGLLLELVRQVIEAWRAEIKAGGLDAAGLAARLAAGGVAAAVDERLARDARKGFQRAVNATGVVLHTGLGRAPVHPEAAEAMRVAAGSYGVLEVARDSGQRNQRDDRLSELLVRLTGAEAGIGVNNNAAAVLLVLNTFSSCKETIVSRGELVEIGGSFRVPSVMERAGVTLREVGTTNRTRMEDYRAAIGERTGMLMKVHTSNFRVQGFTHEVTPDELATLGAEHGVPTSFDLGSGLLETEGDRALALGDEPRVRDAVSSGVDVVTFSGDKLLGGPQAGLLVGKHETIAALRKNPIYRAVRLDKAAIAGLEATLNLMLAGRGDELPARRMLLSSADELRPRAEELARQLGELEGLAAEVVPEQSQPGSGSAPGVFLDTFCVRVTHATRSADALAAALRRGEPPVFVRIHDDALLLDPRTLLAGDDESLVRAFGAVCRGA